MLNQTGTTSEEQDNRIDSIRSLLSEDDYFVDSMQIADRVIDIELALAGNTRKV